MGENKAPLRLILGGKLTTYHPDAKRGAVEVDLETPTRVDSLLKGLGIPVKEARVLMLNHKKAFLNSIVRPGDRLGIFPPELAFNLYVALELAHNDEECAGES
ncbi:MAG: hypothetical protein C0608_08070 [Deltaproteobacteria bacterium]|nr:MAG: hypothetical protein C0608_08070 [Deltaproteobacteria bacterium]